MRTLVLSCLLLLSCPFLHAQENPSPYGPSNRKLLTPDFLTTSGRFLTTEFLRTDRKLLATDFVMSNRKLLMTEFAVRQSDAMTTYMADGSGMCPTCRETELPQALSRSLPGMMLYSGAVSAGVDGLAAVLWRRGHHKLARTAIVADAAVDGSAVAYNVRSLILYAK